MTAIGTGESAELLAILARHWEWALTSPRRILAGNAFGNLLVEVSDGSIFRVCPEDLEAVRIAGSERELHAVLQDEEFSLDWEAAALIEAAAQLGVPGSGQCYGFRIWPVLGGGYTAGNMVIKTAAEWLAVSGDIGRQVKDLPPGAQIRIGTGDA